MKDKNLRIVLGLAILFGLYAGYGVGLGLIEHMSGTGHFAGWVWLAQVVLTFATFGGLVYKKILKFQ